MDNNFMNDYNEQPIQRPPQVKKPKKKGGFKKFMSVIAFAVCFGFVAGAVMLGVEWAGEKLVGTSNSDGDREVAITDTKKDSTDKKVEVTTSNVLNSEGGAVVMDVSDVVEEVMPSIVSITSTQIVDLGYSFWFGEGGSQEQTGAGSGIIVGKSDTELLIVTNNHVVADSDSLSVQFINEESVEAYIKGTKPDTDLAVVSIPLSSINDETLDSIKIATLGASDELEVGEGAIAIGNALGYGQSVTTGVISAIDREVTVENTTLTLMQTDAAINPGNSGGALLNTRGEVIGINAAKYSSDNVEGMGFAIPISSVKDIINDLMNKETKMKVDEENRGYIGINGRDVDATSSDVYGIPLGVYVYSTAEGGGAEKAGIQKGYVITALDGESVSSLADLQNLLEYYEKGEKVTLTVQVPNGMEYKEKNIEVTLSGKEINNTSDDKR